MEREFGIGGRVIVVRVRVRVWVAFFHEAFETDRTERFRVIGARDPPTAHVAEERLNSAAAGRHDSTSSLLSSNRNATSLLWFLSIVFSFPIEDHLSLRLRSFPRKMHGNG